jgi:hypothetical protein
MPTIAGRKISMSLLVIAACLLGIGIGLFALNLWHATNCSKNNSSDETQNLINSLNRRLLQSESQVI